MASRGASRSPGWLQTLLGACVLLVVGFGVGLVAGAALEDPGLVLRAATQEGRTLSLSGAEGSGGETTRGSAEGATAAVGPGDPSPEPPLGAAPRPLGAPAPPASTGSGAAEPPAATAGGASAPPAATAGGASAPPAATAGGASAPPAAVASRAPAAEAAPRPRAGWAVQVGAFADAEAAEDLVARLRGDSIEAYVARGGAGEAAPWRVRVGPYASRERADAEAQRLQRSRRLPTWVLAEDGS